MHTTQHIKRKDHLSKIILYASICEDEAGRPINLKMNENFLGFIVVTDQTGLGLVEENLNSVEEYVFSLLYKMLVVVVTATTVFKG